MRLRSRRTRRQSSLLQDDAFEVTTRRRRSTRTSGRRTSRSAPSPATTRATRRSTRINTRRTTRSQAMADGSESESESEPSEEDIEQSDDDGSSEDFEGPKAAAVSDEDAAGGSDPEDDDKASDADAGAGDSDADEDGSSDYGDEAQPGRTTPSAPAPQSPLPPTPAHLQDMHSGSSESMDVLATGTGVLEEALGQHADGGAEDHNSRRRYAEHALRSTRFFRANLEHVEKPRQLVFLTVMCMALASYAFWRDEPGTPADNAKQCAVTASLVYLVYCVLQTRDGLLVRPHPAVWRVVHGAGVLYLLLLCCVLVLSTDDAMNLLKLLFPVVGKREGGKVRHAGDTSNCDITIENITVQLTSTWFLAHVLGWWAKMCIMRDVRFCIVLATLFELTELTLQHVVPEFAECWWDSVFMDSLGANLIGMFLGWCTLKFLDSRHYDWVAYRPKKTIGGTLSRVFWQFTPFSWSNYNWGMFHSVRRFTLSLTFLFGATLLEIASFLHIHTFRIPHEALILKLRLALYSLLALPAASELYAYMTRPLTRIGQNMWLFVAMLVVEVMVIAKFGEFDWTPPTYIAVCWGAFSALMSLWLMLTFWWYRGRAMVDKSGEQLIYRTPALDYLFWASFVCLLPLTVGWVWPEALVNVVKPLLVSAGIA